MCVGERRKVRIRQLRCVRFFLRDSVSVCSVDGFNVGWIRGDRLHRRIAKRFERFQTVEAGVREVR